MAEFDVRTDKGNTILVGAASCWRARPLPELKLFDAPFDAKKTEDLELAPPPPTQRWPWYVHEAIGAAAGVGAALLYSR